MKTRAMPSPHRNRRGFLLLDCVMYLALLALILGMTYAAFYRAHENAQNLDRNAAALVRALRAGERWREDVRSATVPPRVREDAGETLLELPQALGVVRYRFREGIVSRQAAATTNWVEVLPEVKSSRMESDPRRHVTAWRWEVELRGRQKVARVKPLFTFQAVTSAKPAP